MWVGRTLVGRMAGKHQTGGWLDLFRFKPHSWLTSVVELSKGQIWPTLKAETLEETGGELLNQGPALGDGDSSLS